MGFIIIMYKNKYAQHEDIDIELSTSLELLDFHIIDRTCHLRKWLLLWSLTNLQIYQNNDQRLQRV